MTREDIYKKCTQALKRSPCLLLQAATGVGKTKIIIDLLNLLAGTTYADSTIHILLLVAKRVHKQTWAEEVEKWGGLKPNVEITSIECYESLKKYTGQTFDIIRADEVHHIKSDMRLDQLASMQFKYFLGLSATIPRNLRLYFRYKYKAEVVSCNIVEAIEDEILPEPQILLFPLKLDNTQPTETLEINAKKAGQAIHGEYKDLRKYKRQKVHAILSCTQQQKLNEINSLILWEKNRYMRSRNFQAEKAWLYHCGKRLEFLANCKNQIVLEILDKLKDERTITFCKTISQCETLGKNCIHSKNQKADATYNAFNQKKINHITAVNILNENANLVECKYAVFANLSSSEVVIPQRLGRAMRHKQPVIIMPYYKGTREEEIVQKMTKDFDRNMIRVIKSVREIK